MEGRKFRAFSSILALKQTNGSVFSFNCVANKIIRCSPLGSSYECVDCYATLLAVVFRNLRFGSSACSFSFIRVGATFMTKVFVSAVSKNLDVFVLMLTRSRAG